MISWQLEEYPEMELHALRADAPYRADTLLALLPEDERHRYKRILLPAPKQRFLVARAGLRTVLADRLQIAPQQIQFCYGGSGKPLLPNNSWHFSLCHSGRWVLIALHPRLPVGVDLEVPRRLRNPERLLERFSMFQGAKYEDMHRTALVAWTRAEAVMKAVGRGIGCLSEIKKCDSYYRWQHAVIQMPGMVFLPDTACQAACALVVTGSRAHKANEWRGQTLKQA